jgi:hypothetical protein
MGNYVISGQRLDNIRDFLIYSDCKKTLSCHTRILKCMKKKFQKKVKHKK